MATRQPKPERFNKPAWVLQQKGLHPTLQSDRSLVLQSDDGPVRKVTVRLEFASGKRTWHYRYIMRHYDKGAQILEYYSGIYGDPSYDEQVEAWVESEETPGTP